MLEVFLSELIPALLYSVAGAGIIIALWLVFNIAKMYIMIYLESSAWQRTLIRNTARYYVPQNFREKIGLFFVRLFLRLYKG